MSAAGSRLQEIFQEVADLEGKERERVLRQRCGADDELLARVQGLLDADGRATNRVLATGVEEDSDQEIVGPYRILKLLGEGGMGAVHLAEQREPVQRLVALKRIRPGAHRATTQVRFEAERQILAQLDHPAIARVYDAGASASGLPWFAMEYVEGPPLLEACDRARVGIGARIELFLEICDAVQHAHGKGVVHCDLTPRNVLVAEVDGNRRPKIIDFGIARVLTVGPINEAEWTAEHPVGTWLSMAPEQIDPHGLQLDTRVDVYALGVMLYELVAGAAPFDADELSELQPDEARSRIAQREPPLASARAGRGPESAALARGVNSRGLARLLSGDLDSIIARGMAKDRDARYSTVAELALDLKRYLAHEPVAAAAGGFVYRAVKLVRRNRIPAAALLFVFLSLVVSLVGIESERQRARTAEADAHRRRAVAEEEREEAEATATLVQSTLLHVGSGRGGTADGARDPQDLLALASEDAASLFAGRPHVEAAARLVIGKAFLSLGEAERSKEELLHAYALEQEQGGDDPFDVLAVLEALISATRQVDGVEATHSWVSRALEVGREALREEEPELLGALDPLLRLTAGHEVSAADAERAFQALEARLGTAELGDLSVRPLARLLWEAGDAVRAHGGNPGVVEVFERLGRQLLSGRDARYPFLLLDLAQDELAAENVRFDVAERLLRELLEATEELQPDHWMRTKGFLMLGEALFFQGREGEAEEAFLEARVLVAGVARKTSAHEPAEKALRVLAAALLSKTYGEERLDGFLRDSLETWSNTSGEPGGGWWPVTWPEIPTALVEAALRTLDTEPNTNRGQRARAFVRLGRAGEALENLSADDAETHVFRSLALRQLKRLDDAAAELSQAERLQKETGGSPALPVLVQEARRTGP